MKKIFTFILLFAAVLGAKAQTNLVTCGDFETTPDSAWTKAITQTGTAANDSKIEFINNSKNAYGGNYYANGGSSWNIASKSFTATLTNRTSVSLTAGTTYGLTFWYKSKGITSISCTLTNGDNVLASDVTELSNKTSWTEYTTTVTPSVTGDYTLAFNIGDTRDSQKQDYFQIDDVSLTSTDEQLEADLAELRTARDTYDTNTLVYQYLNSVITKANKDSVSFAKENYKNLSNIKFSDSKNDY